MSSEVYPRLIQECLDAAARCHKHATQATTPSSRKDFLDMERRWRSLAKSYALTQGITGIGQYDGRGKTRE